MTSKINRRTVLGGLATAAAMTSVTDLGPALRVATSTSASRISRPRTDRSERRPQRRPGTATTDTPRSSSCPAGNHHAVGYTSVPGGIRHDAAGSALHICPLRADHGTQLRELQFYIETGTDEATVGLFRLTSIGVPTVLAKWTVAALPVFQTVTVPIDHGVNLVDFDYELWVTFHNSGTLRGARVGSIVPATGLVTVAQNRKLDTRGDDKPVLGSITTVDLAPDIPLGARAALVNITATQTVDGGFVTAFPGTQVAPPTTSSLNWTASNVDIANAAVVQLENGTTIKLAVGGGSTAATHLICDVLGYFI